jgi:hypothetical protein
MSKIEEVEAKKFHRLETVVSGPRGTAVAAI